MTSGVAAAVCSGVGEGSMVGTNVGVGCGVGLGTSTISLFTLLGLLSLTVQPQRQKSMAAQMSITKKALIYI